MLKKQKENIFLKKRRKQNMHDVNNETNWILKINEIFHHLLVARFCLFFLNQIFLCSSSSKKLII